MIEKWLRGTVGAALLLAATSAAAQQPPAREYGFNIIASYPHDIEAFTQGLVYRDGYLYEGTGKNGRSSISKINLDDGAVLMSAPLPRRYFGEGIELVGDRLFQLTWKSHIVFVYSRDDFGQIATHYNATEGWGLAWNGSELIMSDGSAELQFMDPDGFTPLRKVAVTWNGEPLPWLNELEYIDGEVWANVWQTDLVARIDPQTGRVNAIVDFTGLSEHTRLGSNEAVLNGIAWDAEGQRLFVTGKHWAHLFEVELVERATPDGDDQGSDHSPGSNPSVH